MSDGCSIFSQVPQRPSQIEFEGTVRETHAEAYSFIVFSYNWPRTGIGAVNEQWPTTARAMRSKSRMSPFFVLHLPYARDFATFLCRPACWAFH